MSKTRPARYGSGDSIVSTRVLHAGPKVEKPHRHFTVMIEPHPDCRACDSLREKLNAQVVENGRLRVDIYAAKAALRRRGLHADAAALDRARRDAGSCIHGIRMSDPCPSCGIVEDENDF